MEVFVARQPVFDVDKNLFGYELLFRDGMTNAFPELDGDTATSKLLSNTFFTIGIQTLSGGKNVLVNFTKDLLLKQTPTMFPKENLIVEILEDVDAGDDVVSACKNIAESGYTIALDDFLYRPDLQPLVDLADIIKIDFRLTSMEEIEMMVGRLSRKKMKFLAEKVETHEEFEKAVNMGFAYFQGYFFSRPEIMSKKDISPSKFGLMQMVAEVNKPDFNMENLDQLITRDVSISYKLLRYMNSPHFRRIQEISSIKQALIFLGRDEIKRFISLISVSSLADDKPNELMKKSIIRARLCELIGAAVKARLDLSECFLVGLFSMIDAMLDNSMADILENIALPLRVKEALVEKKGPLAALLYVTKCYEEGLWKETEEVLKKIKVDASKIPEMYFDAVGWAEAMNL